MLWHELDPRGELIRGDEGRPGGMIEGFAQLCDAMFFVDYHAQAADGRGVVSHLHPAKRFVGYPSERRARQ